MRLAGRPCVTWLTPVFPSSQSRGFSRKSQTFLPKVFFRKMSSSGAKDKPELQFPFLQDEETVATLQDCKTLFILRGLPGSGKSTLARSIVDRYRDGTKMVSADSYKITPGARGAFSEEYKRLDEDLAAYCRRDVRILVLDDTNHERERLEQLFELADQYQYQVVLVEPKTAWRLDCAQLKEKNQWQLSADDLKKLKPGLEKDFLPLYFGWFLTKKSSEALRKTGQTFLEELGNHKAFKKELRHCRWRGVWVGALSLIREPPRLLGVGCCVPGTIVLQALGGCMGAHLVLAEVSWGGAQSVGPGRGFRQGLALSLSPQLPSPSLELDHRPCLRGGESKLHTVILGSTSTFHRTLEGESGPMFSNSFLAAEPFSKIQYAMEA